MGIIISSAIKNAEYAKRAIATEQEHIEPELSDKDEYRLQLQPHYDMAEEYLKEAERLQQKAMKNQRMAKVILLKCTLAESWDNYKESYESIKTRPLAINT